MDAQLKTVEVDKSVEVDYQHVKLANGRVIPKTKRAFRTRQATTKDGRKVELTLDGVVYERVNGALVRLTGKPKLSKAEKKAAKRQANALRQERI